MQMVVCFHRSVVLWCLDPLRGQGTEQSAIWQIVVFSHLPPHYISSFTFQSKGVKDAKIRIEYCLACFDHLQFSHFSSDTCGWGHNGWREPIDGRVAWHSGVGCCLKSGHCWDVGSTGRSGQLQSSLLANQASVKRCVRLKWKKINNMIVWFS